MSDDASTPLKLVVFASRILDAVEIEQLERQGILIVGFFGMGNIEYANLQDAEVAIVELGLETSRHEVTRLLEEISLPVLLHSGPVTRQTLQDEQLVSKLRELGICARKEYKAASGTGTNSKPDWVVILCASVGGPKAIGRFLSALPEGLNVVFLVVQHMAREFQPLLAGQLSRSSGIAVAVMNDEHRLNNGEVWIVPADSRIELSQGRVRCSSEDWGKPNRPSMDDVLGMASEVYGNGCGVIFFSGVGYDGVEGGRALSARGGFVWTQDSDSCVVPGLPDAIRQVGIVELTATPENLAAALYRRCVIENRSSL